MKNNTILITILVAIIVGGIGFFGGTKYQSMKVNSANTQNINQVVPGRFAGRGGAKNSNGVKPTIGQIVNSDANSITVKMKDGSSKIILLSNTTLINKTEKGTISDLTNGTSVAVIGTSNSDGSVTAQNVQINPMNTFGRQKPSPSTTP